MTEHADRPANRLAAEKSPYLLQHAHNPVDWYPWGEEAFARARDEDKPIFLSIGYSTCHWCHVMERESFEDEEVARLMNQTFVSIKVDREERPDIDSVYMTVCQMLTGRGGWPMTVILTPDKRPFHAGTYYPKTERFGHIGMLQLVPRLGEVWRSDRDRIEEAAGRLADALRSHGTARSDLEGHSQAPLDQATLVQAFTQLSSHFDQEYGGFGSAPKFPSPHTLLFLLRHHHRTGDPHALAMVVKTLTAMRLGGIFDHIGLGFHRYSTDAEWLLPHFEKMLYDQAMLAMAYTEAFLVTNNMLFRTTAEEILAYVQRDLADPLGGFHSAEDADSEGEEGKFYVWTTAEVRDILGSPEAGGSGNPGRPGGENEAELFIRAYNLLEGGNFNDESTGRATGANIPHLTATWDDLAAKMGLSQADIRARLAVSRQKLLQARQGRVRPSKDDKVLTDWNGLMIAAMAKASRAFGEPRYLDAAVRAADFITTTLRPGELFHRYRDGEAGLPAHIDDYAFLAWGLLELYEAGFDDRHLSTARDLVDTLLERFWDQGSGGFFFTAAGSEDLPFRHKELYDGAIPSGNAVAMMVMLRLARLTWDPGLEGKAASMSHAFAQEVAGQPSAYAMFLTGLDFALGPSFEVVITGEREAEDTRALLSSLDSSFRPRVVTRFRPTPCPGNTGNGDDILRDLTPVDGKATAYICHDFQCGLPATTPGEMIDLLDGL